MAYSLSLAAMTLMLCLAAPVTGAAEIWVAATDPLVATSNDCGFVSNIHGTPLIRRSFQGGEGAGVPAHAADRLGSGDELIVPAGGRLEWTCGANTLLVLGPKSHVKLGGLRSFPGPEGIPLSRLDITLLAGEMRVQVRHNIHHPEAVLISGGGGEAALRRGDMAFGVGSAWHSIAIAGDVMARTRRGEVTGAPMHIRSGASAGAHGERAMDGADLLELKLRLPFSHEAAIAAKPPLPSMSGILEAP